MSSDGLIDAEGTRTVVTHLAISKVPPRSYVVAFGQRGLGKTYEAFCHTLKGYLDEHNDHVHGVPCWRGLVRGEDTL